MQYTNSNDPNSGLPHRQLAYRINDFCREIGIGRTTFYELLKAGRIRTVTIGGRRLVPADEARRLLSEGAR